MPLAGCRAASNVAQCLFAASWPASRIQCLARLRAAAHHPALAPRRLGRKAHPPRPGCPAPLQPLLRPPGGRGCPSRPQLHHLLLRSGRHCAVVQPECLRLHVGIPQARLPAPAADQARPRRPSLRYMRWSCTRRLVCGLCAGHSHYGNPSSMMQQHALRLSSTQHQHKTLSGHLRQNSIADSQFISDCLTYNMPGHLRCLLIALRGGWRRWRTAAEAGQPGTEVHSQHLTRCCCEMEVTHRSAVHSYKD